MENAKDILQELEQLSPAVNRINREMPYKVPESFFNTLSDKILKKIAETMAGQGQKQAGLTDEATEKVAFALSDARESSSAILNEAGKRVPFSVPAGYFEHFAQAVLNRIHSEQAGMGQTSPSQLAGSQPIAGMTDPSAQQEIEELSPLLSSLRKSSPSPIFRIPDNYFSELPINAISGLKAIEFVNDELENLSPLMSSLKDKPTYQVPDNYFEQLSRVILARATAPQTMDPATQAVNPAAQVLQPMAQLDEPTVQSVQQETGARVISMHKRRNWLKYSAAAVLAGILVTSGWFGFHRSGSTNNTGGVIDVMKNLSKVSDQDIQNYLDNHNVPLAEAVSTSTANLDMNDSDISDIKTMLGDVPDDELRSYLEEHGGTRDLATN